jgi:carbon starvation protein
VAAALMVGGWGYFLIQGVRDPLGGINSLWPLFGIANQMLAAIALCLGTTIILKMALGAPQAGALPDSWSSSFSLPGDTLKRELQPSAPRRSPWLALVTLVPLVWLLAVTFTAGLEKIFHPDPRIGFLAQARNNELGVLATQRNLAAASIARGETGARERLKAIETAMAKQQALMFNNRLDAAMAGAFLVLVSVIVGLSLREWHLLLTRRKPAVLHETEPVWLPDYALKETGPNLRTVAGAAAIALGLARELSGETHFERAREQTCTCQGGTHSSQKIFAQAAEEKFNGIRRCC